MSADNKDKFIAELRELIIQQNDLAIKTMNDQNQQSFKEMYDSFYIASSDQVKATRAVEKKLDEHIARLEPVAQAFEHTTWLGRFIIQILKVLGLVAGGIGLYVLVKNLLQGKY